MDCLLNLDAYYVSSTASIENGPPRRFSHRANYPVNLHNTLETLLLGIAAKTDPNALSSSSGLLVCLLENCDGLAAVLAREFPAFPKSILNYLSSPNAFAPGSTLAPECTSSHGISFVEDFLGIANDSKDMALDDELPGYHLGRKQIRSMPLAVWTGGYVGSETKGVPLLMVIGEWEDHEIFKFIEHCKSMCGAETRLQRLEKCNEWIFHDLFSTFMDWNGIWDNVRDRLGQLDYEVHSQLGTSNILGRMQSLNKAIAANIMLRETLHMQKTSLETIMDIVSKNSDAVESDRTEVFLKRARELWKALEHYWGLANGNKEQLQNLVSMMISLEQISQGESVGRLNLLAFTFLPLSFIASVFGMTQFTISPKWYPAYALPMLCLTIITAVVLPKIISGWHKWQQRPRKPRSSTKRRRFKTEKNLGRSLPETSVKKSYPPVSMGGGVTATRGREVHKSTSSASLKHHVRRNSLPNSLRSRRGSPVASPREKRSRRGSPAPSPRDKKSGVSSFGLARALGLGRAPERDYGTEAFV